MILNKLTACLDKKEVSGELNIEIAFITANSLVNICRLGMQLDLIVVLLEMETDLWKSVANLPDGIFC